MNSHDIQVGRTYTAKVSGRIVPVRIIGTTSGGGWIGMNTATRREVWIKSLQRLRSEIKPHGPEPAPWTNVTTWQSYQAFKAEDPERILIFESDTTSRPTLIVYNGDIAAIEACGVAIPDEDKLTGDMSSVALIPNDRLEAVLAAIIAGGKRAAVLRRVGSSAAATSEVQRVVLPGSLMEIKS